MKSFFKTPLFWTLFIISSGLAGILAMYYFPQATPIIYLNLTMNRSQAIEKSKSLAEQFSLGPTNALHAAQFQTDEQVKTFVELEAGGKEALVTMMEKNLYQPYTWMVRRFKPFDQHELFISFTPDGLPYEFEEIISENTLRPNITAAQAQNTAETFATLEPWHIKLSDYKLIETSQEKRVSGRIDHIFTYERIKEKIGEGFYHLKIVVSGDRVSTLSHSVKVPDAFIRRYQHMRSANENIAYTATILIILLYIVGCCFIGLFFLIRDRWIIWRAPFYWGLFIATLIALNIPNQLPLAWMHYNTALSPIGFLLWQGISIIYTFIFFMLALTIIFMTAESLSRRAFGHQLQFWRLYNPPIASTYTVLGYTITGYLLMPILLCYTVLFFVITTHWLGWWNPSSALFNPNILATYFPWLESISISLQAGFFEECLFRAIPLASAALLGNHFGKRSWWITGAFILQAVIFGAAHANYPNQPAYARLVELLADSALFGSIYLWLGLLPTIITHFVYDVFWFALPIFVSTAPGAFLNKIIIIFLALLPLFIILACRLKIGTWHSIQQSLLNSAWQPPAETSFSQPERPIAHRITLSQKTTACTYILGILAFVAWLSFTQFSNDAPSFDNSRNNAQEISKQILGNKNIDTTVWYPITYPFIHYEQHDDLQKQHRFIWQEGGKEVYHHLRHSYLKPPHWITRFLKFEGSIIDRAEEYQIHLKPDDSFLQFIHKLPETKPGPSLEQSHAESLALAAIEKQFNLSPNQLQHISAVAFKQPERLDWLITYASNTYPLKTGQARIAVQIAGNEIIDAYQYIHVPEQWSRNEDNRLLFANIISQLCKLIIYLIALIGALIALLPWHVYFPRSLFRFFFFLSCIFLFELFNAWPTIFAKFNTSQPFFDQLFRSFTLSSILLLLRAMALTIMFSFVTYFPIAYRQISFRNTVFCGISLGIIFTSIKVGLIYFLPSLEPQWANYTPLQFFLPFSAGINSTILHYISLTILLLLCIICMNKITKYGTYKKVVGSIISFLAGYIIAGLLFADNLMLFSMSGIVFAIFFYSSYYLLLRFDYPIIPIISATYVLLENVQQFFFHSYPLAEVVTIFSSCAIGIIGWLWSKKLHQTIQGNL